MNQKIIQWVHSKHLGGGKMKINGLNLQIAIARSCMTTREIQKVGKLSNATIVRAKSDINYEPELHTIGKLARALGVSVEYLIEGDSA